MKLFPFLLCFIGLVSSALAHPMDQYRMEMTLLPDRVQIKVMTTLTRSDQNPVQGSGLDATSAAVAPGFPSFLALADGQSIEWAEELARELSDKYGTWMEYNASHAFAHPPFKINLTLASSDLASFVLVVHYPNGKSTTDLLSARHPVEIPLKETATPAQSGSQQPTGNNSSSIFAAYVQHGIWHILTGYDHMLFMAALVLAATSFWDLVKVVTAFTLAHTVTLTLSVLDIVRLNERIVEPMIAASIVFVALQNIFYPAGSRGWIRLAVAFGFGLFHGLGFAGGLLEAMSGLSGVTVITAIAAFSIGVELGHQVVVVPLYSTRCLIRKTTGEGAEAASKAVTKWGSALIALAGSYYLVSALFP